MNNCKRKPLIGLIALSAALATPMAFAQDETTQAPQPTPTETTAPTESAAGASVQSTGHASAASGNAKQGWADVDADKDGAISKQEASSNAGLSQVFGQADANTDGKLTVEEYKAFVSKNYGNNQADPKGSK